MVEHLTFNQGVTGSRPVRPTSNFPTPNPPLSNPPLTNPELMQLLPLLLKSRRQGTAKRTIEFYKYLLTPFVNSDVLTPSDINRFLSTRSCSNGKHAYYRALRAFCNWLYKQSYITDNPIEKVDPPKLKKVILPSLTDEQVEYLIEQAGNIRDKTIISLLADSGIRLNELLSIKEAHIDFDNCTVIIWGKGAKQKKRLLHQEH